MSFKLIPGNDEYEISLIGSIRRVDGELCDLPSGNEVTLEMFGKQITVDRDWLMVISQYELTTEEMVSGAEVGVLTNDLSQNSIGWWIRFRKPITYLEKYRVVASNPMYAVSNDGELIRMDNDRVVVSNVYGSIPYPCCSIYTPSLNKFSSNRLHRLVALAWCENTNPTENYIVDHLDAVVTNYNYDNLEWVSNAENIKRALALGSSQSKECKIRQHSTGEVFYFPSISAALIYFNIPYQTAAALFNKKRSGWISDEYELKLADDDGAWRYSDTLNNSRYETTVTMIDGSVTVYYGIKELYREVNKYYKQPFPRSTTSLTKLLTKVNGVKSVDVKDYYNNTRCEAKCEMTNVVIFAPNFTSLAKILGIRASTVRVRILKGDDYVYRGYRFRQKTDLPWSTVKSLTVGCNFRIKVTDMETKITTVYDSIRGCSDITKIPRSRLNTSLKEDRPVAGIMVQRMN